MKRISLLFAQAFLLIAIAQAQVINVSPKPLPGIDYSKLGLVDSIINEGISKNQLTEIPGHDLGYGHVLTPEDVLLDFARIGDKVVVYDNTAYEVGPGIAEMLADKGKEVYFVTIDSGIAMSVTEIGINKVLSARLLPKVKFINHTLIQEIDPEKTILQNYYTGEITEIPDVHNVILVTSKPPQESLYHALQGKVPELHIIGDAREAKWSVFATDEAIKDGRRIGMML